MSPTEASLRPATPADIPFVAAQHERPEFHAALDAADPERLAAHLIDPDHSLLIWETDAPAGFALLSELRDPSGRCKLGPIVLAEPGRGAGGPFLAAVIAHVFGALGRTRLHLDVAVGNHQARRAYERAGFVHEGTLRRHWWSRTGDLVDLALYGLLREEAR